MTWDEVSLPNLLTLLNILLGFLAVNEVIQGEFQQAAFYILIAVVVDLSDGILARKMSKTSNFGKELDSLADLVSFGFAPAILVYQKFLFPLGELGLMLASLHLLCGAIRLARYNTQAGKKGFTGLPIPASGGLYAALIFTGTSLEVNVVSLLILVTSALMVSRVPYPKVEGDVFGETQNRIVLFVLAVTIAPIFFNSQLTCLPFIAYVLTGLIIGLIKSL
ncbi:CDP-diacylglycerol--serine O-phosphatidyltransferase [Candidatus Altiarchaeota archaeon]